MKNVMRAVVLCSAFLAMSCGHKSPTAAAADNIATINDDVIARSTFNMYVQGVAGKPPGDLAPEQRAQFLENMLRARAIAIEAERSGLAAKGEVRYAVDMARLQVLQQAVSQEFLKDHPASEDEIRAEYALRVASAGKSPPPSLESMREQLARYVEEKKFQAYVDALLSKNKVIRSL